MKSVKFGFSTTIQTKKICNKFLGQFETVSSPHSFKNDSNVPCCEKEDKHFFETLRNTFQKILKQAQQKSCLQKGLNLLERITKQKGPRNLTKTKKNNHYKIETSKSEKFGIFQKKTIIHSSNIIQILISFDLKIHSENKK